MLKIPVVGIWTTCVVIALHAANAHAAAQDVVLYASDAATLRGNWLRTSDSTAGGGQRLTTLDNAWSTLDAPLASPSNYAEFTFNAEANTSYRVWLRLRATGDSKWNDSLFVQFNDAVTSSGTAVYRIGTAHALLVNLQSCNGCALAGWGWMNGAYWLQQPTVVKFSTGGAHTLRVQTREDGVLLDEIVLSAATYLSTAPGPVLGDTSIVPRPAAPSSPTPFTGVRTLLPGVLETENFDHGGEGVAYHDTTPGNTGRAYRQTDVDAEPASDGAYNIGWIAPGEWLGYSVHVASSGDYLLEARVASSGPGGTFHIELGGSNVTGALVIPNTGGWQNWTTVSKMIALNAGPQMMKLVFDGNGSTAVGNVTWIKVRPLGQTPYTSTAALLPGSLRAVDFDNGGEGVAYHDMTADNSGGQYRQTAVDIESGATGYNVGWIADGEWLSYTVNVSATGPYRLTVQVASPIGGGIMHARFGATDTVPVTIPKTGGWQNWTTVVIEADLTAGVQTLRLVCDRGGFNIGGITVTTAPSAASTPSSGTTLMVAADGDFQAALNNAHPGDTILLQAGATFVGNFVLPVKNGGNYITIRSSTSDASLPGPKGRINPSHAPLLPKLRSPNFAPALSTEPGAHHYHLMFLEFVATHQGGGEMLRLGDGSAAQNTLALVPHELIVDRVYMRGHATYGQKRAIALNSASTTIANCYIAEIKAVGQDSQAIAGWNGPGPYLIENNYLEAAGENVIFGGSDPKIPNLVPSDITIRRNHFSKQLAWRSQPQWTVKNLFELKNAQRVVVDGNVMEYNWRAGQSGYAILFTPRNQDGGAPWTVVRDVQFTNNIVRDVAAGINLLGRDYLHPSQETANILIRNNLFENVSSAMYGGSGGFILLNGGVDVTIDHNTIVQDGLWVVYGDTTPTRRLVLTNNIIPDYSWAIMGAGTAPGTETIRRYFPSSQILRGIFIGSKPSIYPTGNFFPTSVSDVGFVNAAAGNYRLSPSTIYRGAGTDGTDIGCDFDALSRAVGTAR